ncbi:hypothetical protein HXY32_04595 [Candidatus Bathyarchaeota archaeon]|nr:hypothetical protein [Candidatus Bathyarchaeota archaeon]
MAEKNTNPKEKTEQPPNQENQSETVEEAHFFHPVQLSERGEEILDEKEIEKSKVEIEQKLQELLKSINEETLQLSEFLMEESKLLKELCISLRHILKKLNISFNIPPQDLPLQKRIKKVILNEEGHLILVYEKGEVNSAFLAEYPPEIVMAALWIIMPELAKVVMLYRKKISTRVNFFGKVKKELKSVVKAIVGKEGSADTDEEQMIDVVQESVKTENQG